MTQTSPTRRIFCRLNLRGLSEFALWGLTLILVGFGVFFLGLALLFNDSGAPIGRILWSYSGPLPLLLVLVIIAVRQSRRLARQRPRLALGLVAVPVLILCGLIVAAACIVA